MRFPDLVDSGLLDAWRTSIIDDGPVRECLNRVGKRIEFVPKNMVLNREDCRLEFSFRYIARMLTWSRLLEKTFWLTGVHAALYFTTLLVLLGWCLAGTLASLFWALGWGQLPVSAVWAWTALGVWVGGQALGYELVRAAVLSHAATTARGEIRPVDGLWRLPRVVMAIPVATVAYSAGCLAALRVKRVVWRKVAYEIETGHNIKMVDYAPFASESQSAFEHHSI
jgi:hypothetical protein